MRQCHVTSSQLIHATQHGQRVVDRVTTFHANQRSNFPAGMDTPNICGGISKFECLGVSVDDTVYQIDLLDDQLRML